MNEAALVGRLLKKLRTSYPKAVVIKHADRITSGIPDISISWHGKTTWLEVKFANPNIIDRGIQRLMLKTLEREGSAFYVIYDNLRNRTLIVLPQHIDRWEDDGAYRDADGFDHDLVVKLIKETHS